MSDLTLTYNTDTCSIDLLLGVSISIAEESASLKIPGGNPVVKPICTSGKTVTFDVLLYGSDYSALQTKKITLENFIENHGHHVVTVTCVDTNYSGSYVLSLDGEVPGDMKNEARYRIRGIKVYA